MCIGEDWHSLDEGSEKEIINQLEWPKSLQRDWWSLFLLHVQQAVVDYRGPQEPHPYSLLSRDLRYATVFTSLPVWRVWLRDFRKDQDGQTSGLHTQGKCSGLSCGVFHLHWSELGLTKYRQVWYQTFFGKRQWNWSSIWLILSSFGRPFSAGQCQQYLNHWKCNM